MDTRSRWQEWSRERTWSLLARSDVCSSSSWCRATMQTWALGWQWRRCYITCNTNYSLTSDERENLPTNNLNCERYLAIFGYLAAQSAAYSNKLSKAKRIHDDLVFPSSDLWTRRWKFLTKWKYPGYQSKRSWKRKDYLRIWKRR